MKGVALLNICMTFVSCLLDGKIVLLHKTA